MKRIKLTQGYYAKVDDEDFDWLNQWKWCAIVRDEVCVYAYSNKKGLMHRLILELTDSKVHTDHIDRDGLNNQRSNLRRCTPIQNNYNKGSDRNSTSKYVGVHKSTIKDKSGIYHYWVASIGINKKVKNLGNLI